MLFSQGKKSDHGIKMKQIWLTSIKYNKTWNFYGATLNINGGVSMKQKMSNTIKIREIMISFKARAAAEKAKAVEKNKDFIEYIEVTGKKSPERQTYIKE